MLKKKEESGMFVKVSMDGAPYLRKIDLKVCKGYKELREALENMFKNFSLGNCYIVEQHNKSTTKLSCKQRLTYLLVYFFFK